MPKVSILIPVYNVEKYLQQCLESIVTQTLQDIEIICINDGSTDRSFEILRSYQKQDRRIIVIDKPNSGYGASMNLGLKTATGEYIGIVEPDDFVKPEMFSDLYKLALKHDVDIVKSDYYEFSAKENQTRKSGRIPRYLNNQILTAKEEPKILKILPSIWSAIYKRDFLIKNNIEFLKTSGASFQDTSFAFKTLALAKTIYFTQKAYLYYRIDSENSSVKSSKKVYAICDEYAEITNFLNEHLEIKEYANDVKLKKEYAAYIWNAKRISIKHRNDFIEKFSQTFKTYEQNGELTDIFYKKYSKKEIKTLLNDTKAFCLKIEELCGKEEQKQNRRKMFSVRINTSRLSIIIAGKKVAEF